MTLTPDEIRMLLGMCVRGLRDLQDSETEGIRDEDRVELSEMVDTLSYIHSSLHPWAPDVDSLDGRD
jgi:hypothetical protein